MKRSQTLIGTVDWAAFTAGVAVGVILGSLLT
jgi:hypothetical protein